MEEEYKPANAFERVVINSLARLEKAVSNKVSVLTFWTVISMLVSFQGAVAVLLIAHIGDK